MIQQIKTKAQSKSRIIELDLNRVPEIFIDKHDKKSMENFFMENVEDLYIVRDAEKSSSKYFYVKKNREFLAVWNCQEHYFHCYERLPIGM